MKSKRDIFNKGSYTYHTTIKAKVIDRDVAVMIPLNIEPYPRKTKRLRCSFLAQGANKSFQDGNPNCKDIPAPIKIEVFSFF